MTSEEEKAVKELQSRIKNYLTPVMREDVTIFYRFLKARDFDVDKAEKMLRKNIIWRKIFQADTILQNLKPDEFFLKYVEPSFIGYDKDGDMVFYSQGGSFNVFDVYKSMKVNNLMKEFVWFVEKHIEINEKQNKKTGKCRYQASIIINTEKLTLRSATSKLTFNLFFKFINYYQDNYPERLKYAYVINAPRYFVYLFSILKRVMSNNTLNKIHVCGYDDWAENLLEYIDADVLPAFLGGKRTDPDGNPLCRSFIKHDITIPEKYFLTDEERYFHSKTKVKTLTVSSQEKKEINIDIKKAGLVLEWEFLVRNKDIGFGLFLKGSQNEIKEVIPIYRYDTSDGTEKDSYKCCSPGAYIIVFENSYSWMGSTTVEYSINIINQAA